MTAAVASHSALPELPEVAGVMRKAIVDMPADTCSARWRSAALDTTDVIVMTTEGARCSAAASAWTSACRTAGSCSDASDKPLMAMVTVTAGCTTRDDDTRGLDE